MRSLILFALFCSLVVLGLPAIAQTPTLQPAPTQAAPQAPAARQQPVAPQPPVAPQAPAAPLADPAAYLAQEFGPTFKLDPKFAPLVGDLDGDGKDDLVLFATSPTPLAGQGKFHFKVEDPYDAYFGAGDVAITSQFNIHFDGSGRSILVVFGWREPKSPRPERHPSKYVLINTPMESATLTSETVGKKTRDAIDAVDRTRTHSLIFWTGKRWRWSAGGMDGD